LYPPPLNIAHTHFQVHALNLLCKDLSKAKVCPLFHVMMKDVLAISALIGDSEAIRAGK
jgi:hypothetical protein